MNADRAIALILALSVAVVLLLGIWLLRRAHAPAPVPEPTMAATSPPSPIATATPTSGGVPAAARGYRLAGTVVGDLAYAIIEDPHGGNQLYHPGQTIPGLGQLTGIEADRITLAGSDGSFALQLAPAPTLTATPPRSEPAGSASASVATPASPPRRVPSRFESSP